MEYKDFLQERARILMAYELDIPPDDLYLEPLFQSVFRAIRESCESKNEEIILTIKNEEENLAILGEYGQMAIQRLFGGQYPFEGIVDEYQTWYVSQVLNKMDDEEWGE